MLRLPRRTRRGSGSGGVPTTSGRSTKGSAKPASASGASCSSCSGRASAAATAARSLFATDASTGDAGGAARRAHNACDDALHEEGKRGLRPLSYKGVCCAAAVAPLRRIVAPATRTQHPVRRRVGRARSRAGGRGGGARRARRARPGARARGARRARSAAPGPPPRRRCQTGRGCCDARRQARVSATRGGRVSATDNTAAAAPSAPHAQLVLAEHDGAAQRVQGVVNVGVRALARGATGKRARGAETGNTGAPSEAGSVRCCCAHALVPCTAPAARRQPPAPCGARAAGTRAHGGGAQ